MGLLKNWSARHSAPAEADRKEHDDDKVLADLPIGTGVEATKFDGQQVSAPGNFDVRADIGDSNGPGQWTLTLRHIYLLTAEF